MIEGNKSGDPSVSTSLNSPAKESNFKAKSLTPSLEDLHEEDYAKTPIKLTEKHKTIKLLSEKDDPSDAIERSTYAFDLFVNKRGEIAVKKIHSRLDGVEEKLKNHLIKSVFDQIINIEDSKFLKYISNSSDLLNELLLLVKGTPNFNVEIFLEKLHLHIRDYKKAKGKVENRYNEDEFVAHLKRKLTLSDFPEISVDFVIRSALKYLKERGSRHTERNVKNAINAVIGEEKSRHEINKRNKTALSKEDKEEQAKLNRRISRDVNKIIAGLGLDGYRSIDSVDSGSYYSSKIDKKTLPQLELNVEEKRAILELKNLVASNFIEKINYLEKQHKLHSAARFLNLFEAHLNFINGFYNIQEFFKERPEGEMDELIQLTKGLFESTKHLEEKDKLYRQLQGKIDKEVEEGNQYQKGVKEHNVLRKCVFKHYKKEWSLFEAAHTAPGPGLFSFQNKDIKDRVNHLFITRNAEAFLSIIKEKGPLDAVKLKAIAKLHQINSDQLEPELLKLLNVKDEFAPDEYVILNSICKLNISSEINEEITDKLLQVIESKVTVPDAGAFNTQLAALQILKNIHYPHLKNLPGYEEFVKAGSTYFPDKFQFVYPDSGILSDYQQSKVKYISVISPSKNWRDQENKFDPIQEGLKNLNETLMSLPHRNYQFMADALKLVSFSSLIELSETQKLPWIINHKTDSLSEREAKDDLASNLINLLQKKDFVTLRQVFSQNKPYLESTLKYCIDEVKTINKKNQLSTQDLLLLTFICNVWRSIEHIDILVQEKAGISPDKREYLVQKNHCSKCAGVCTCANKLNFTEVFVNEINKCKFAAI